MFLTMLGAHLALGAGAQTVLLPLLVTRYAATIPWQSLPHAEVGVAGARLSRRRLLRPFQILLQQSRDAYCVIRSLNHSIMGTAAAMALGVQTGPPQ